jgi:hypothetical protein
MLYLWYQNMTSSINPLRRHFRQPSVYLRLPSQGKFYANNSLNYPPNEELPVLPMTAVDEITARTPDALFNGSAVVDIVRSCVPNITDPWNMPSIDLNSALVAIRLASYGHMMEIGSTCPNCGHSHEFEIDLRIVMDGFGIPDYSTPLLIGDLSVQFAPLTYKQVNENNKAQFEDQKLISTVNQIDTMPSDERLAMLGDSFRKITNLTIRAIASSIASISSPDGVVSDQTFINEFLRNCEKAVFNKIRDQAIALRETTEIKPLDIICENCKTPYRQEFSLDMTNFFETNS